ncbi:MAG: TIM barrel protein [Planctomycetota bacterium]
MKDSPFRIAGHIGLNAPDDGLFKLSAGDDPVDQIRFMHDEGFTALEDNFMKLRPAAEQERIGAELQRLGMSFGTFVATFKTTGPMHVPYGESTLSLASDDESVIEQILDEIRESVEVGKRLDAAICTVLSGPFDPRQPWEYQTAQMIKNLRRCAEIAEAGGLTLGIEPINGREWPNGFMTTVPHAYLMASAVNSPACKLIFDAYHVQIETGSLLANLEAAWDQIAYIQIADAPGRNELGTGEINYATFFQRLRELGYDGIIGVEHGKSKPGVEGETAVISALRQALQ